MTAGDIVSGAIRRSRTTQQEVAHLIGISTVTMSRKIRGGVFTLPEIEKINKRVGFTDDECCMLVRGAKK